MKKLKQWAQITALALGALGLNQAMAHGDAKPSHGGSVQMANDLVFELVAEADGVTLYVRDHDQALPTQGITGKLTLLRGSQKTESDIQSAGENKLRAPGVKIAKGDKLVAVLSNVKGKNMTVRFTLR